MDNSAPNLAWEEGARSTHFLFEHKIFQIKGVRFAFTKDGVAPAFHFDLGALDAALPLSVLHAEFGIAQGSSDSALLNIVKESLRFVKEIRPGDSIPRELLDGTASWSVEDRHRLRARGRLCINLVAADPAIMADDAALRRFVESADTKTHAKQAAKVVSDKLHLTSDGGETVMERIDDLARELAYIEALRERCGLVPAVVPKLNQVARVYRADRAVVDEVARVRTLLLRPVAEYDRIFNLLDGLSDDIPGAVRDVCERIDLIRERRDDLHQGMMMWEPIFATWASLELVRSAVTEAALTELYRFTARHFPQGQSWRPAS